ncbi:MAG: DUF2784 domain-containing protein [Gammaproteobacteria bacterium]|nr:DUF2784 domain-containing protein [Gammaproteobacteria bacterium]
MTYLYGILADATLIAHLMFIAFVTLGGFLVWRWHWLAWAHIPAIGWAVAVEWLNLLCPLTPWEQHFRHLAGRAVYSGDFIDHYVRSLLYPSGLTRSLQMLLGAILIAINVAVYLRLWFLRRADSRP